MISATSLCQYDPLSARLMLVVPDRPVLPALPLAADAPLIHCALLPPLYNAVHTYHVLVAAVAAVLSDAPAYNSKLFVPLICIVRLPLLLRISTSATIFDAPVLATPKMVIGCAFVPMLVLLRMSPPSNLATGCPLSMPALYVGRIADVLCVKSCPFPLMSGHVAMAAPSLSPVICDASSHNIAPATGKPPAAAPAPMPSTPPMDARLPST